MPSKQGTAFLKLLYIMWYINIFQLIICNSQRKWPFPHISFRLFNSSDMAEKVLKSFTVVFHLLESDLGSILCCISKIESETITHATNRDFEMKNHIMAVLCMGIGKMKHMYCFSQIFLTHLLPLHHCQIMMTAKPAKQFTVKRQHSGVRVQRTWL